MQLIKKYFIAGIAALFPLFITIYIIAVIYQFTNRFVGNYINAFIFDNYNITIPGLGFVITVMIIIILGFLSTIFVGRKLLPLLEKGFLRIPFVTNIYPPAKQLSNYLFKRVDKKEFREVVLVPSLFQDSYSIGFITNDSSDNFIQKKDKELVTIFVPFAPVPFTGIIILVPKEKIEILDVSIDQAVKFIVSGGVINPS
ncbi:MAG: DUF502 domain-containing protein [Elusimicrobia bacterium]|nr:DUF502 domain-containing protein [Elusimicrobiota bacterium]